MAESIETSDIANKSFYSNVFVLLFIVKLHIKKFKQFCLSDLLVFIEQNTFFVEKNQKY